MKNYDSVRDFLADLEIGGTVRINSDQAATIMVIDCGNMRLSLLKSNLPPDSKPEWYRFDENGGEWHGRGWRKQYEIYSGSLIFDESQPVVKLSSEKEKPKVKPYRSTLVHSSKFGYLDPSDRYDKQLLDG